VNKDVHDGSLTLSLALGNGLMARRPERAVLSAIDQIVWLDRESRADVRRTLSSLRKRGLLMVREPSAVPEYVAGSCVYEIVKSLNRSKRREWSKTKQLHVRSGMKLCRAQREPVVFYLVSSHQKPQKAHADLQGQVLVDRYWRAVLETHPRAYSEVESYLRTRPTMTVQEAMDAPHYLIARPNCRHRLIPLPTQKVLSLSKQELRKAYNKAPTHVKRPITDAERYRQLQELKSEVYGKLSKSIKKKP
jgi:hypothetical protein